MINCPYSKVTSLSKWVEELNINVTLEMWKSAFRLSNVASHCSNHWESHLKTLHRWYPTPYRLSKINPGNSTTWTNCGSVGTIVHLLWFWKSPSSFWRQIFSLISAISQVPTTPSPSLALLHLGIEKLPTSSSVVVIHLLHAAKLNITRLWKTSEHPLHLQHNSRP